MSRARFLLAVGAVALLGAGLGSSVADAGHRACRLHVEGHLASGSRMLDIDVPWDSDKGGSPFNFTDSCNDIAFGRLARAWTKLQTMPEGRTVTIESTSESILAWRQAGYLVLEPQHNQDDHHSRIKIPDYIVNTMVDHDGRISQRDIERLASERGKVTLVKVSSDQGDLSVWVGAATKDDED